MRNYIFKMIGVQLSITLAWMGIAFYWFGQDANPIQIGISEWLLRFAQFTITGIVGLIMITKSQDKNTAQRKLLFSLLISFLVLSLSVTFDGVLWRWIWTFRNDVIQ